MKVLLQRGWADSRATLGLLTVIGVKHDPFFVLENPKRETKADSRIPAGLYNCIPYSGTHFKDVFKVLDVPGRSDILFHWGNTEKDTLGCLLIGNAAGLLAGEPAILDSKNAFSRFRKLVGAEGFTLDIRDHFPF